jgi:serine/threonine-protein phosphatase 2A regulatory subunit B
MMPPSLGTDTQWCFSQVKGAVEDDDITEADIISCVEFNHDGDLLATGDKGGRVVIFQQVRLLLL